MFSEVIGIIGMGSYATCHFFRRLLDAFPGEKEWDRPQIIIDNNCTMPSRVKAILYKENEERLQKDLVECAKGILRCAEGKQVHIVMDCNTAHYYIPYMKEAVPQADFMDIIEICGENVLSQGVKDVVVLASEGVFETKLYDRYFKEKGINVEYPISMMKDIRYFIESVKQNRITSAVTEKFYKLLSVFAGRHVILGCTELPVVYEKMMQEQEVLLCQGVHDPLDSVIQRLQQEMK